MRVPLAWRSAVGKDALGTSREFHKAGFFLKDGPHFVCVFCDVCLPSLVAESPHLVGCCQNDLAIDPGLIFFVYLDTCYVFGEYYFLIPLFNIVLW